MGRSLTAAVTEVCTSVGLHFILHTQTHPKDWPTLASAEAKENKDEQEQDTKKKMSSLIRRKRSMGMKRI